MAYVPPNKRNGNNNNNTFHVKVDKQLSNSQRREKKKRQQSPTPNVESVESFPTLGNHTPTHTSTSIPKTEMNFASSLFVPQPKEEILKAVPDGWVHIRKTKTPKFLVGEHSERYYDMSHYLGYKNELRRHNAYYTMIERYEYYKELDEEINGPTYLNIWELDTIKKDNELEEKLARMNETSTSDESSEDETIYEFN